MIPRTVSDPFSKIKGNPPPGYTWTLVEHKTEASNTGGGRVVSFVDARPEIPEERKARLLREAADLIRQGTQLSSPIGSKELREGLIRIAEALEVETE